ncbi:MAG: DUF302 domain-containing protein [Aquificae bacterium]|nr:DUF302 domain-containing protein [Aquificota bacterium]
MRKTVLVILLLPLLLFSQQERKNELMYVDLIEGMPFEDVVIFLKTALDGKNMNVIEMIDVSQNPKMTVFYVCNLGYGEKILRDFPEFGALAPCRVYVLERGEDKVEIGYINVPNLIKTFEKYLSPETIEVLKQADRDMREAIAEVKGEF